MELTKREVESIMKLLCQIRTESKTGATRKVYNHADKISMIIKKAERRKKKSAPLV